MPVDLWTVGVGYWDVMSDDAVVGGCIFVHALGSGDFELADFCLHGRKVSCE